MREHLGVDVDVIDEEDPLMQEPVQPEPEQEPWNPEGDRHSGSEEGVTQSTKRDQDAIGAVGTFLKADVGIKQGSYCPCHFQSLDITYLGNLIADSQFFTSMETAKGLHKPTACSKPEARQRDMEDAIFPKERKDFTLEGKERTGFASSEVPAIEERIIVEHRPPSSQADGHEANILQENLENHNSTEFPKKKSSISDAACKDRIQHLDIEEQDERSIQNRIQKQWTSKSRTKWKVSIRRPYVDPNGFEDPISDAFWKNVWLASAAYNVRHTFFS